jgi:hypothetical protein
MKARKRTRRIPLTITLDPRDFSFIESCVSLKEFRSVDEQFDASLSFYRRHLEALQAYAEDQGSKGYSRAEILESIELETLITKAVTRQRKKRAERARAMRA